MNFNLKLYKIILCLSLVFCTAVLYAENSKKIKFGKKLSSKDIVYYLASDELEGRSPGTKGDSLSVDFINSQLQKLGYDTYIKSFGVTKNVKSFNIYGVKPGQSGKYIVVGAHYDHLGFGGKETSSRRPDTLAVHNGADDNASGVAGVLAMAKRYARVKNNKHGYIFATFGAEEIGIVGSKYFQSQILKSNNIKSEDIIAMINFDMIGMLRGSNLTIGGTGTALEIDSIIANANSSYHNAFSIAKSKVGHGPSDHASFYAKKIPVFFFTTGVTEDYHTPFDDANKLNYLGIDSVANFAALICNELQCCEKLSFQETGSITPTNSHSKRNAMKVTLGIMPDVTGQIDNGLRADIVVKDKPAYNAGLKNGDIIIAINGIQILNIQDYMKNLGALSPNSIAKVKVLRDGGEMYFDIKF